MADEEWTEHDIQSLKAQEAKDLAVEFLHQIQNQNRGPISPGEVQLQELEYELKLKQAEIADQSAEREHQRRMKELELEIEQERARAAESRRQSDEVRGQLRDLVERVRESEQSLAFELERSKREHRIKLEQLEAEYAARNGELEAEQRERIEQRDRLIDEIKTLNELQVNAEDLNALREAVDQSRHECEQQRRSLEEELSTLEFEKTKRLNETLHTQELELAKLQTDHEKEVLKLDREAAETILARLGMQAVTHAKWQEMESTLQTLREQIAEHSAAEEERLREKFRREYNINTDQPIDVTDLFYQHRAISKELADCQVRLERCEAELTRARTHIESEPQRIAKAVESARTSVQNIVEPAGKR